MSPQAVHLEKLTPALPTRAPGSMTVSILFGWQSILVGLVLLLLLAAVVFLLLAAGRGRRDEWEALLASRSTGPFELPPDLEDAPAGGPVSRPGPR